MQRKILTPNDFSPLQGEYLRIRPVAEKKGTGQMHPIAWPGAQPRGGRKAGFLASLVVHARIA